jgi:cytochrome c oxidase cbb3-type subunit III
MSPAIGPRVWLLAATLSAPALIAGCKVERVGMETAVTNEIDPVRVKTSTLEPGPMRTKTHVENRFADDPHAVNEGKRYYEWFNCMGCHGAIGGGSIGPPLKDSDWIYGGAPEQIFASIIQGRPEGMPAYGGRIADDVAWKLVAYVQSLGGQTSELPPGQSLSTSAGEGVPVD